MRKPKPLEKIALALSGSGVHGRSALYRWLWDHYDQIYRQREGRPNWVSVTDEMNKLNVAGPGQPPLKPDNVRKTWKRVVRDRGKPPERIVPQAPPRPTKAFHQPSADAQQHHAGHPSNLSRTFSFEAEARPGDRDKLIGPPRKK